MNDGPHTLKVVVKDGNLYLDSIDIMGAVYGTVSKTALSALITQLSSYSAGDYMPAEWSAFANALTAAQAVVTDNNATQYAVDNALNALQSAATALKLKNSL